MATPVQFPLDLDHFQGGANLTQQDLRGLVRLLNDLVEQLPADFEFSGIPVPADGVEVLGAVTSIDYSQGPRSKKNDIDADALDITISDLPEAATGILHLEITVPGVSTLNFPGLEFGSLGSALLELGNGDRNTLVLMAREDGQIGAMIFPGF